MSLINKVKSILSEVSCNDYSWRITKINDYVSIQVEYPEKDIKSGVLELQVGRHWLIPETYGTGQILQTALKAILTSYEHRVREHFLWREKAIFQPHFDPEELLKISPSIVEID